MWFNFFKSSKPEPYVYPDHPHGSLYSYSRLLYLLEKIRAEGKFLTRWSSLYDDACRQLEKDGLIRKCEDVECPTRCEAGETYWTPVQPQDRYR